jgi:hypothetical protein
VSYQVSSEVFGQSPYEYYAERGQVPTNLLGNHNWPPTLKGYDFRVSKALGIDAQAAIDEGRSVTKLPPLDFPEGEPAPNPLTTNPAVAAALRSDPMETDPVKAQGPVKKLGVGAEELAFSLNTASLTDAINAFTPANQEKQGSFRPHQGEQDYTPVLADISGLR